MTDQQQRNADIAKAVEQAPNQKGGQIKDKKEVHGALARVYCAHYDNCLILIFDDGRWAHYMAHSDDDGDRYIEFEIEPPEPKDLLGAGLLSNDEYRTYQDAILAASEQAYRDDELATLARLKAKYEVQP